MLKNMTKLFQEKYTSSTLYKWKQKASLQNILIQMVFASLHNQLFTFLQKILRCQFYCFFYI